MGATERLSGLTPSGFGPREAPDRAQRIAPCRIKAATRIPTEEAGVVPVPGSPAVAAYDDEWFVEYAIGELWGDILLLEYETKGNERRSRIFRQSVFNIGHLADRRESQQWNEFVAAKQAQLARCPPGG